MASITVTTQNEFESVPHNATLQSFLSLVSIVAPPAAPTEQIRRGIDLVAVLDRSGSMAGEKMKMLHHTVEMLIKHLNINDRLCLICYDDNVETPLVLTRMDESGKSKARDALRKITEGGSTNLCGGLIRGLDELANRQTKNEVSSVLLMTDGLANRGITDKTRMVEITIAKVQALNSDSLKCSLPRPNNNKSSYVIAFFVNAFVADSATVYTFGFGSDHDAALLGQIADVGRGSYYFMNTTDSIPQAFADCVGGLMSVVAQNIQLTITAASQDNIAIHSVVTNFPQITLIPTQKIALSIGDIFSEERKDFLIELHLPAIPTPADAQVLLAVELSVFDITTMSTIHTQTITTIKRTSSHSPIGASSLAVDQHRNRIHTARAMEQAMQLGDIGLVEQARILLERVRMDVDASASSAVPESQALLCDLSSIAQSMHSQLEYEAVAHKKLNVKARKHWTQRAAECDVEEADVYVTNPKLLMRTAFL